MIFFLIDGKGTLLRSSGNFSKFKTLSLQNNPNVGSKTKTWKGHIHLAIAPTKDISRTRMACRKANRDRFR